MSSIFLYFSMLLFITINGVSYCLMNYTFNLILIPSTYIFFYFTRKGLTLTSTLRQANANIPYFSTVNFYIYLTISLLYLNITLKV